MRFIDIPTEQTTAATDVILTVVGVWAALYLRRFRKYAAWKVDIWSWVFLLLAFGAGLGAVVHGVVMDRGVRDMLWQPLFLSLAFVIVLVVSGAVYDWKGHGVARKTLVALLVVPPLFWLATFLGDFDFRAFVVFSVPAMIFSLVIYVRMAAGNSSLNGAGWMAAAMLLTIAAGGIQATGIVYITIVWPFDHNGVFHIVQAVGIVVLGVGLRKGLYPGENEKKV